MEKILIIIPTYQEHESIALLLNKIKNIQSQVVNYHIEVLIMDDSSDNLTLNIVNDFMVNHPWVKIISGKKCGLGAAYIRAFESIKGQEYYGIIQMDADLSHDPNDIPRFIQGLEQTNFVLGSRYILGGDTPNWNYKRRWLSKYGNKIISLFGPLKNFTDSTSGFRAFRTKILDQINWRNFLSQEYAIQICFLSEVIKHKITNQEIPIIFHERKTGKSKMKFKQIIDYLKTALILWFK